MRDEFLRGLDRILSAFGLSLLAVRKRNQRRFQLGLDRALLEQSLDLLDASRYLTGEPLESVFWFFALAAFLIADSNALW